MHEKQLSSSDNIWKLSIKIRYCEVRYDITNPIWSVCHTKGWIITIITDAKLTNSTDYCKLAIL